MGDLPLRWIIDAAELGSLVLDGHVRTGCSHDRKVGSSTLAKPILAYRHGGLSYSWAVTMYL